MQLIYGTTNPAKIAFMKKRVEPLGIKLVSLSEVNAPNIDIAETGNNPSENARIKSLAYYRVLQMPVFSCDSGLYIEGLDDTRQPGVHVRNVNGNRLDDHEMIAYYSTLAAEHGGRLKARYRNGICLVINESHICEYMGEDIASEPFYLVAKPHDKRRAGFPLDSLSVHIESGKYYHDTAGRGEKYCDSTDGFTAFFQQELNKLKVVKA